MIFNKDKQLLFSDFNTLLISEWKNSVKMSDVVSISDSEEEVPAPKRQKLGVLDEICSSEEESDEVPAADDLSSEEMSLHESEDIENAGQSEVCSSSEPILISSSEYEANNSDRYLFFLSLPSSKIISVILTKVKIYGLTKQSRLLDISHPKKYYQFWMGLITSKRIRVFSSKIYV